MAGPRPRPRSAHAQVGVAGGRGRRSRAPDEDAAQDPGLCGPTALWDHLPEGRKQVARILAYSFSPTYLLSTGEG